MTFKYSGNIESSKSIVNRALILKALHPELELNYYSQAEDVLRLQKCLNEFDQNKNSFDVGSGGTTFRFFSLFISKFKGNWYLKITKQLYQRPQQELLNILTQLGVKANFEEKAEERFLRIESLGWQTLSVEVDFSVSSQFFSALVLAASDSKDEFTIHYKNREISSGYEDITLNLIKQIGIGVRKEENKIIVCGLMKEDPGSHSSFEINAEIPLQTSNKNQVIIGADWSSLIYIFSFAFTGSSLEIKNVDLSSFEPDKMGLPILKNLGLDYKLITNNIKETEALSAIEVSPSELYIAIKEINQSMGQSIGQFTDLRKNPDLFPVVAILLSQLALKYKSEFKIIYPEQLVHKESNRLLAIQDSLFSLGYIIHIDGQVFSISATNKCDLLKKKLHYLDAKSDHRLIMSYELLKAFGYQISYTNKEEVKKSFANFFEIVYG